MAYQMLLAAEAVEQSNPILPVTSELFWGAVCFAALWTLVKFVLLPPVKATMNARADQIQADLDAADQARASAGSAAGEVSDQLSGVRAEAAEVVDAARAEAEAERSTIVGAADAEVATMRAAADAEIEAARAGAMTGVRPQVATLAANAASRVMNRTVDPSAAQPVVDRFLDNPN
jgi:F-type H+-transporting ATPase subunit b